MDLKEKTRKSITVQAELLLAGSALYGWKFKATDEEGQELLENLLRGTVSGLPYYKQTIVEPSAGGAGEYWVRIVS